MAKNRFTPEQQQMLRENPYTIHVTENTLFLSKEFKEIFYKENLSGASSREILQKYGYPVDVLGKERVWGIGHEIRKQFRENGEFHDAHTPATGKTGETPDEKIRQLEHQVNYLTQEVEFLKKISSIRSTRK